jgi:hypothetical protein
MLYHFCGIVLRRFFPGCKPHHKCIVNQSQHKADMAANQYNGSSVYLETVSRKGRIETKPLISPFASITRARNAYTLCTSVLFRCWVWDGKRMSGCAISLGYHVCVRIQRISRLTQKDPADESVFCWTSKPSNAKWLNVAIISRERRERKHPPDGPMD